MIEVDRFVGFGSRFKTVVRMRAEAQVLAINNQAEQKNKMIFDTTRCVRAEARNL